MRRAVILIALAACELQPAPKKQAVPVEAVPPQPAQPPVAPPQPAQPVADAGVADGPSPQTINANEACIKVASHVVQVFIDTAKDTAQAAIYEQERMKMTKATAEACDRQAWGAEAMKCYLLAKDPKTIKACENKFPPTPAPGMGGGGAGSAAPGAVAPAGAGAGSAQPKGPGVVQPKAAPGADAGSAQPKAAQPKAGAGSAAAPKAAGSAAH